MTEEYAPNFSTTDPQTARNVARAAARADKRSKILEQFRGFSGSLISEASQYVENRLFIHQDNIIRRLDAMGFIVDERKIKSLTPEQLRQELLELEARLIAWNEEEPYVLKKSDRDRTLAETAAKARAVLSR